MGMSLIPDSKASHNNQPNKAITSTPSVLWHGTWHHQISPPHQQRHRSSVTHKTPPKPRHRHRHRHRQGNNVVQDHSQRANCISDYNRPRPVLNPAGHHLSGDVVLDNHPTGRPRLGGLPLPPSTSRPALVDKTELRRSDAAALQQATARTHLTGATATSPPPMCDVTGWVAAGPPPPTHSLIDHCTSGGGQFLLCIVCMRDETGRVQMIGGEKAVNDDSRSLPLSAIRNAY